MQRSKEILVWSCAAALLGCAKPARPTTPAAPVKPCECLAVPREQRPITPTRDEALHQMMAITREVTTCFKAGGIAQVRSEIDGETGHVRRLEVLSGPPHDLDCLSRVYARQCFRPFKRPSFLLSFPFKIMDVDQSAPPSTPHCEAPEAGADALFKPHEP